MLTSDSGTSILVLTDCSLAGNVAKGNGGAVQMTERSSFEGKNIIIVDSSALSGGCLSLNDYSSFSLSGSTLSRCSASSSGGGLIASDYSRFTFNYSTAYQCWSGSVGSALLAQDFSSLTTTNSEIM